MLYTNSMQVLFVCTANVVDMIPEPLLDRMEVINISGYITDDKMHIARDHLLKTTCMECGIKPEQVSLTTTCPYVLYVFMFIRDLLDLFSTFVRLL